MVHEADRKLVALELEGVPDVHGEVGGDEEGEELAAGPRPLVLRRVAAPPQAVHDHRRLHQHLHHLSK